MADRFDLAVVGGGITGCGVAREAASRGLSVAVLEKRDLASGASSKTSRLIHGGYRYLAEGHFRLVATALAERAALGRLAPHLVRHVRFLLPTGRSSESRLRASAGLLLYDLLAVGRAPDRHRRLDRARLAEEEPLLAGPGFDGAVEYSDSVTDDVRIVVEVALAAEAGGASIRPYREVVAVVRTGSGFRVESVTHAGTREALEVSAVVLAAGAASAGESERLLGSRCELVPSAGSHLRIRPGALPLRHPVTLSHPRDGRKLFAIPSIDGALVGTTEAIFEGDLDAPRVPAAEQAYLLEAIASAFPAAPISRGDVVWTFRGVRPLAGGPQGAGDPGGVSREHRLDRIAPGLFRVVGGKLTTFRRTAAEVVTALLRDLPARTGFRTSPGEAPLPGFDPRLPDPAPLVAELCGDGIPQSAAARLVDRYGGRARVLADRYAAALPDPFLRLGAERPALRIEAAIALREEHATTLADVAIRRLRLLDSGAAAASSAIEALVPLVASLSRLDPARSRGEERQLADEIALGAPA